ncbi:MAG TPA: c-type cytochrome domain-containing protein [Verrucomicrobiae bacterium]|nr:c-type cytochrome domain-containing protein [Verrucomicrobiae bacterium]
MKKLMTIAAVAACSALGLQAADSKPDFSKDVLPILQQQCFKCHGPEKQKGKLRLDSKEAALKGGKTGPAFVAGDASKSELIRRVSLPKTDDDFMPNEGEPLSKAQLELLKDWINQGATWTETATAKVDKPAAPKGPELPADFKPSAAEQKAIAALAQKGIDVRPIAANLNWREANLRLQGTNITDATIAPLKDVLGLVDLNLATTRVTDAGLAQLKGLTNLQRLHLELTGISDAGIAHLKGLPNLVYLNLYGTKVSDAGLDDLKDMRHLRNLYVWQSKVTEDGAKKLKTALPEVDISTGWDLAAFAKIEEARKEEAKKEEARKKEEEAKKKEEETKKKEEAKKEEAKKEEAKKEEAKKDDAKKDGDKPADKKDDQKADKKEEKK